MKVMTVRRDNLWPPKIVLVPAFALVSFVWSYWTDRAFLLLISIFATAVILLIGAIWALIDLFRGRLRRAFSVLCCLTAMLAGMYLARIGERFVSDALFRFQLSKFDDMVADQRNKMKRRSINEPQRPQSGDADPVRMVVYFRDRSLFAAASNVFEYIVYDETDKIQTDPESLSGYWPYPASGTGKIAVDSGDKSIRNIYGHYYRVVEIY